MIDSHPVHIHMMSTPIPTTMPTTMEENMAIRMSIMITPANMRSATCLIIQTETSLNEASLSELEGLWDLEKLR